MLITDNNNNQQKKKQPEYLSIQNLIADQMILLEMFNNNHQQR